MEIVLGQEVKDTVSGFTGVAVSRHSYLAGCHRITIQPPIDKDGKLPESQTFDETQLVAIGAGIHGLEEVEKPKAPGGPSRYEDEGRN